MAAKSSKFFSFLKFFFSFMGATFLVFFVFLSFCTYMVFNKMDEEQDSLKTSFLDRGKVAVLRLEGIIFSENEFLKHLLKYRKKQSVKSLVVVVNSPGGVVGKSQEIYQELVKTRTKFKKPVIVYGESLVASGAYYAALGADYIYTNKGTLVGSIGVVSQFLNLEDLYRFIKVRRFNIRSGKFKDTGASYRKMTGSEKKYLQSLSNELLSQFKEDISEARKLSKDLVNRYADGRIYTGKKALEIGLIDKIGSLTDAISYAGRLSGLGEKPQYFFHKEKIPSIFARLLESKAPSLEMKIEKFLGLKLLNIPLFLFSPKVF